LAQTAESKEGVKEDGGFPIRSPRAPGQRVAVESGKALEPLEEEGRERQGGGGQRRVSEASAGTLYRSVQFSI